jgi:glutaredoxin-related protein
VDAPLTSLRCFDVIHVYQGHTLLARHAGSNAELLLSLLKQHAKPVPTPALATASSASAPTPAVETPEQLDERCRALMNKHKVVLFMKGNPSAPKCGFSRQTVGLLREKGIEFAWFDILSDEGVRQGLKKLNDWPSEWFTLLLVLRCKGITC